MSDLPRGWIEAAIGTVCKLQNGRAFKPSDWRSEGVPIVRIQNLNNASAPYNYFAGEIDDRHALRGGELLFAWSGTPGTSFGAHVWRGGDAALNQHIFRIDFDVQLFDRAFLRHAINLKVNELIGMAHGGVGLRHVTKGVFEATKIFVAPRVEQQRIAEKLDVLLAQVEYVRYRLESVIATLNRFRQSVFAAAVSGQLSEDWRSDGLGNWTLARAAEVCSKVQSGGTPKAGFLPDGIPFLKVYNIVGQRLDFFSKPQYVAEDVHLRELSRSIALPGDVLMNIVGPPLGKVAVVTNDFPAWNINQALVLFRPSDLISTGWLYIILRSGRNIAEMVHETRGSAGQVNISLSQCRDFVFPVPPRAEQDEIVRRVAGLFKFADAIEARCNVVRTKVEHLTSALLAKAFRGELVPQDPTDEPASALLERLRAANPGTAAQPPTRRPRGRPKKVA